MSFLTTVTQICQTIDLCSLSALIYDSFPPVLLNMHNPIAYHFTTALLGIPSHFSFVFQKCVQLFSLVVTITPSLTLRNPIKNLISFNNVISKSLMHEEIRLMAWSHHPERQHQLLNITCKVYG